MCVGGVSCVVENSTIFLTLPCHLVKLFERVVRKSIVVHLEDNNLLPDGQHGFRSKRSCLTQLLSYWDNILDLVEQGK